MGANVLDSNRPYIVYDAGGIFQGAVKLQRCNTNLSTIEGVQSLFTDNQIDYSAWTYSCFPIEIFLNYGLPLPFFIWYDDVEYGLRIDNEMIIFPGIVVHHPYSMISNQRYYYFYRNSLITFCSSKRYEKQWLSKMFKRIMIEIFAYRYETAKSMIQGISDFLKGPDYVFEQFKKGPLVIKTINYFSIESLKKQLVPCQISIKHSLLWRLLSINGLFLKSIGDVESKECELDSSRYYRINQVLYHINDRVGYIAKRNLKTSLKMIIDLSLLYIHFSLSFKRVIRKYQKSLPKYSSIDYWSNIFDE